MPAIAIVGAGMSISAGVAAGVTTLIGGLQVAAGVLTIAGAVTGNKKLMLLGSIASLGAGVANWASSAADAAGAVTQTAGETLSKAALDGTTSFGANSVPGAFDVATTGLESIAGGLETGGLPGVTDYMTPAADGLAPGLAGVDTAPVDLDKAAGDYFGADTPVTEEGIIAKAVDQSGTGTATDSLTSPAVEQTAEEVAAEAGGTGSGEVAKDSSVLKGKGGVTTDSTASGFKGKATALMDFLNDKKNAGVIKVGSGIISGAANAYAQQSAAKAAVKAREESAQRDRDRLNNSIAGLNRFK